MKLKFVKLLSTTPRYSAGFTQCGLRFRRYCCSKNDGTSRETADAKNAEDVSATFSPPDSAEGEEPFVYPEPRIKTTDYMEPLAQYLMGEFKNSVSFRKRRNIEDRKNFPFEVEFLILGAGPIGSSIAFWLKKTCLRTINVLVVDKNLAVNQPSDSTEALKVSLQSSACALKQEYELKEHVELSQFGAEFIRNMESYSVQPVDFPPVPFEPFGFLTLSNQAYCETLKKIHSNCLLWKGYNELLTPYQLNQRFPWLNADDVELAMHGLKNEGWFDPDIFLMKMRSYALNAGAQFVEAEPLEFIYSSDMRNLTFPGFHHGDYQPCQHVYLKLSNGDIRKVQFATCIVALGPESGAFAKEMLHLNKRYRGMHHFEVPIVPRKRRIFSVRCPDAGPGISSPLIVDPTGLFVKRHGPLNEYICGCPPLMGEESIEDMNEHDYFHEIVWPLLAARIPVFERLHLKSAVTYYEDFNVFDGSPIVGFHPAYHNVLFATGFGDRSHQHAAGIGRAVSEIYQGKYFKSIDITRFNFNRILQEVPLFDSCVI